MALIRSFTGRATTGLRLNRKVTDCQFFETASDEYGRLLVLRTFAENAAPGTSPAQVFDLDVKAAQELRKILNDVFGI